MNIHKKIGFIFILTVLALSACASPAPTQTDELSTIVAQTMQAMTREPMVVPIKETTTPGVPPGPPASATPYVTMTSEPGVLPHALYFSKEGQIFRLGTNREVVTQITYESPYAAHYKVSLTNGLIAYMVNNQIVTINTYGKNKTIVFDGGPLPEGTQENYIDFLKNQVEYPVWSNNGNLLVFSHCDLNIHNLETGSNTIEIPCNVNESEQKITRYRPISFSADDSLLLVFVTNETNGVQPGGHFAVYSFETRTLTHTDLQSCCGQVSFLWGPDNSIYYTYPGSELLIGRFDPFAEQSSEVITGSSKDWASFFVRDHFIAPDGKLYYFVSTDIDKPYSLYRANLDGTGQEKLFSNEFKDISSFLWAPDGSMGILSRYKGNNLVHEIIFMDGRESTKIQETEMFNLQWGP